MINIHKISLAYFLMAVLSTPVYAVTSDQGQASVAHEPTAQEPIVKISSGAVLGRVDDGVYAFKGIPYARSEERRVGKECRHRMCTASSDDTVRYRAL